MESPKPYRHWLVGVSLGAMIALLIWPATRAVVRTQLKLLAPVESNLAPLYLPATNSGGPADYTANRMHEAAVLRADDFRIQLADALIDPPGERSIARLSRLRALTTRFPGEPSLYASLLRVATIGAIRLNRKEDTELSPGVALDQPQVPAPDPGCLARFDADAAAGEQLDPNNAYFPCMRAVGLFTAHRDSEALASVERAMHESEWQDYSADEVIGEWSLYRAAFGDMTAMPQTYFAAQLLLPHFGELRAVARVATVFAIHAEQSGDIAKGLEIRSAVRHYGDLMAVRSSTMIGNLVGIAVASIAYQRPGGAPWIVGPTGKAGSDEKARLRLAAYCRYLSLTGHDAMIPSVQAEAVESRDIRNVAERFATTGYFEDFMKLPMWWLVDVTLLIAASWMLILGMLGTLALLTRRASAGVGLPCYARRGGYCAAITITVVAAESVSIIEGPIAILIPLIVVSSMLLLPFKITWKERFRGFAAFAATLCCVGLVSGLFAVQTVEGYKAIGQYFVSSGEDGSGLVGLGRLQSVGLAAIAALPLLTILVLAITGLLCRVPLSLSVPRGLRGVCLPIACSLLLAYAVLAPMTARHEAVVSNGLEQTRANEGAYYAKLMHRPWPTP